MKIALVDAFPVSPFSAEREFIARCINVLSKIGHEAISAATTADIDKFDPDLVIVTHELSAKLTDHFTIGPLWSPTQFYKNDENCLQSIVTWDIAVPMDDITEQFATDLYFPTRKRNSVGKTILFPSAPVIEIGEPNLKNVSLCYIGVHWDGVRHEGFFKELAKAVDLHVYGPPGPWAFLPEAYRGPVPFDGRSIFDVLNKHGAVLALHKKSHCEENTPSMRTFEGCAAKCFVITDAMTSLQSRFGENFSYLDWNDTLETRVASVKKVLENIKGNPGAALEKIRAAHDIFKNTLSLDALLPPILAEVEAHKSGRRARDQIAGPEITVIIRCGDQALDCIARTIDTIIRQTYQNISIIFVRNQSIDGLDAFIEDARSTGRFRSIEIRENSGRTRSSTLWVGMQAIQVPFFASMTAGDAWLSTHVSELMDVFQSNKHADIVHSGGIWHNDDGHTVNLHSRLQRLDGAWIYEPRVLETMAPLDTGLLLKWVKTIPLHSFVAKSSLLDPVVLDDPGLDLMEDSYLYLPWVSRGARFVFNGRASAIQNWRGPTSDRSPATMSANLRSQQLERVARRLRGFTFPGEYLGKEVVSHGYPALSVESAADWIGKQIDFSVVKTPRCLAWAHGISWAEPWGRWTDHDVTTLVFQFPLPARFVLELSGWPSSAMVGKAIKVEVDRHFATFRMKKSKRHTYKILVTNKGETNTIKLHYANAKSPAELSGDPKQDDRKLGIAISTIRVNQDVSLFDRLRQKASFA